MLHEACTKDHDEWVDRDPELVKLVCVMTYYPRWLGANAFDINAPELGMPPVMLKQYKKKLEKFSNIAHTMRAWGTTPEAKLLMASYKAFSDVVGPAGVLYKRHLRNDRKAMKTFEVIRALVREGKDVVLFCTEEHPPCHRFLLLQMLSRHGNLVRMMAERKYPKEYLRFANRIDQRFARMPRREA